MVTTKYIKILLCSLHHTKVYHDAFIHWNNFRIVFEMFLWIPHIFFTCLKNWENAIVKEFQTSKKSSMCHNFIKICIPNRLCVEMWLLNSLWMNYPDQPRQKILFSALKKIRCKIFTTIWWGGNKSFIWFRSSISHYSSICPMLLNGCNLMYIVWVVWVIYLV